jgi:two-component system response regulator YesN
MTVFIVEDEAWARDTLRSLLPLVAPQLRIVGEAYNGQQGLAHILRLRPDLVITDIRMARMSGLEMILAAREQGVTGTRFVVISAYTDFALMRQAIRLGVADYLMKPITRENLAGVLQPLLPDAPPAQAEAEIPQGGETEAACGQKGEGETPRHPVVQRAIEIVRQRYPDHLSLDALSEMLRLSPEYFSYLFHRDMGINFSAYLRNYRIERAKALLDEGEMLIYEVAAKAGYNDSKYFCKVFREVTGVSPTQYIRRKL